MKKSLESKGTKSFKNLDSVLTVNNILCLQAMISVRGKDGGDPTIPPPPPGRP